ncbi:uncharacterized protein LOC132554945 [Ylistrum balloti]|uniref:uncharacterized protein LOC132554945 n=1 Tax=Ylistrum balloti TaxID=509963 RepID=UPI002905DC04|nr:uncharacterized protein LOC132554945 [Ylistrum balloti]
MPTASQAMILKTAEGSDHIISRRLCSSMSHLKPAKSEGMNKPPPQTAGSMPTFQKGKPGPRACPGTTPQQIILQGYRGNMFFDQETRRFRWQIISQNNNITEDMLTATSIDCELPEEKPPPPQIISKPTKLLSRRSDMAVTNTATGSYTPTDNRNIPAQYGVDEKSYGRLEELGFRRRFIAAPSKVSPSTRPSNSIVPKYESTDRTSTPIMQHTIRLHIPHGSTPNIEGQHSDDDECAEAHRVSAKTISLIDDIKQKVGYDKRIFPTMYMRKSFPTEQPLSLCFSLREDNISHASVKRWVERETGLKVASIQYDPVSIRAGVMVGTGSRWIVTMTSLEDCRKLLQQGLEENGEKVMVRWLDDICVCEFDAYKIHCQEQNRTKLRKIQRNHKSDGSLIKQL